MQIKNCSYFLHLLNYFKKKPFVSKLNAYLSQLYDAHLSRSGGRYAVSEKGGALLKTTERMKGLK